MSVCVSRGNPRSALSKTQKIPPWVSQKTEKNKHPIASPPSSSLSLSSVPANGHSYLPLVVKEQRVYMQWSRGGGRDESFPQDLHYSYTPPAPLFPVKMEKQASSRFVLTQTFMWFLQ